MKGEAPRIGVNDQIKSILQYPKQSTNKCGTNRLKYGRVCCSKLWFMLKQSDHLLVAVTVRNVGSGGSPDLHLENFSVSNGGPDLIENASMLLASGRRCIDLPCEPRGDLVMQ